MNGYDKEIKQIYIYFKDIAGSSYNKIIARSQNPIKNPSFLIYYNSN